MGEKPRDGVRSFDDIGRVDPAVLLSPLADELLTIATRLKDAAALAARHVETPESTRSRRNGTTPAHLALAHRAYALRRKRAAIFGNPDLFGEPAWDILLDLFIAHAEGKPVSVSSACIGSAAPATTGLRWLGVLADEGLVVRENDPGDQRRVNVRLTSAGVAAMERFFEAMLDADF
jgi:hypothetical protein